MSNKLQSKYQEIRNYFVGCFDSNNRDRGGPDLAEKGVYISSELRKYILTEDPNGPGIIIGGNYREFLFEDCKGGVWRIKLLSQKESFLEKKEPEIDADWSEEECPF